jgi:xanthine dehydrogenase accessory factor
MTELRQVLEEALRLEREGEPGVLATLIDAGGSTPRHDVARMVIRPDGTIVGTIGGGSLEHVTMQKAQAIIDRGTPELLQIDLAEIGMTCGGRVQVLLEPLGTNPSLVIFGAGHVAAEIAPLATRCGFAVMVIDDRPEFASAERFPDARLLVHSFSPEDWKILHLDSRSYAVVVTRGHKHDQDVVEALIGLDLAYLGMMGSKKKVAEVKQNLLAKGISQEQLDHLYSPIGMKISSETPAEIAVSIVGELIQVRRGAEK